MIYYINPQLAAVSLLSKGWWQHSTVDDVEYQTLLWKLQQLYLNARQNFYTNHIKYRSKTPVITRTYTGQMAAVTCGPSS